MSDRVTVTGRINHVASRYLPWVAKRYSRFHGARFDRSDGRRGANYQGRPVFRLTVVGRKSGEPRSVMLMLVRRGDDLLVCGSQGGTPQAPNWWKNLAAAGHATVQVGGEKYEADARVVTDEAERAEAWTLLTAAYPDFASYQALTERVLPIGVLTRR